MSDNYTPSTSTVRQAWYEAPYNGGGAREMSDAEFDRWLESVRAEERERIVRNIEADADDARWLTTSGRLGMVRAARIAREGA